MIINTTIIGLGNIGLLYDYKNKNIQTHAKAVYKDKRFNLIGTVETKADRRLFFIKKYKIKTFLKIKKSIILNSHLVVISTPTILLFTILKKVINLNPNLNILIEKPFGFKKTEINFIKKKFTKNKIYINYYRNFDSNIIELKKVIFNKLKSPLRGHLYYSKGFFHNCSHYIALFFEIFGKIKKVKVLIKKKIGNDYFIEAKVYYKNFQLLISLNRYNKSNFFSILGSQGKLNYDNDGSSIYYQNFNRKNFLYSKKFRIYNKINNYQKEVYNNIYKDLSNKKAHVFDLAKIVKLNEEIKKFNLSLK